MNNPASATLSGHISLPEIPAVCTNAHSCAVLTTDGEILTQTHEEAIPSLHNQTVLVCNAPYTKEKIGLQEFYAVDVLELFAFTHPTRFCIPTPAGLCKALHMPPPETFEDTPFALMDIAATLLKDLQDDPYTSKADPLKIAEIMGLKGKGWAWTPFIFAALGQEYDPQAELLSKRALNVWKHLPEWAEDAPEPPSTHEDISEFETQERLQDLLNIGDKPAETRPQQRDYANAVRETFAPVQTDQNPQIMLAEAGTGVGKTLGYLAPASVWADKNEGSVWISTYTKNLQRQINEELDRLYPNPVVKDAYVSIRKGRENYLCLLNLEDLSASAGLSHNPRHPIAAGIMARWIAATKDGDLSGNDFPGWLAGLLGFANTYGLADRRGECIYSACDHYHRCFIERSVRKAKRSRLVIANHALVMIQSAMSSPNETLPTRYVFDEGHHLFDAADSAFSAHLTARETADLRRWIIGAEGGRQNRARGLKRRIEDLISEDTEALKLLEDLLHHAQILCAPNWSHRFKDDQPNGPTETFLMNIYKLVYARAEGVEGPYSLETPLFPADEGTIAASMTLKQGLENILTPMNKLAKILHDRITQDEGHMDGDTRKRLDALVTSLERRGAQTLLSWIAMLETLQTQDTTAEFVDWMEVERIDGKAIDVGLYRHFKDPMSPFATSIRPHLHGMTITSATLRDRTEEEEVNLTAANERTGAHYLNQDPKHSSFSSPFDYAANTKVFILNDVNKNDISQVANAYKTLFLASGGGALGLFTAIQRLRAVHEHIALPLEHQNIPLYAQHVDNMDTGTIIDMFRDDVPSCLLGTDAMRDGVDVPGSSLQLLVFDRVPWPRPTLLHKARREIFGKRRYDEMIARLKLKQAFGRLVRRADDRGIFVMVDSMLPTRLQSAFPEDVTIIKTSLKETAEEISSFFKSENTIHK